MQELIGQILELVSRLKSVYNEGERFLRARLLSASLAIIQGVRRAIIFQQCLMMACFVWAMSFFATGMILCFPWAFGSSHFIHPALVFSAGTLAVTSVLIYFFWREKTWLKGTGLQDMLDALKAEDAPPPINRRELAALLDELLDEKLEKLARSRGAASAEKVLELSIERTVE
jgi:hypothetical protein